MIIKVRSHIRKGKLVKSHMRKDLKKKVKEEMKAFDRGNWEVHPKTGSIRASIAFATREQTPKGPKGKYTKSHNLAGISNKYRY
jgi:hypothetical protein